MPTLKLPPKIAGVLIDRLSQDDDFRDLFVADLPAALAAVGFEPRKDDDLEAFVKECYRNIKLADKDVIIAAREEITAMLTSGTNHIVPALDAGYAGDRTLK